MYNIFLYNTLPYIIYYTLWYMGVQVLTRLDPDKIGPELWTSSWKWISL